MRRVLLLASLIAAGLTGTASAATVRVVSDHAVVPTTDPYARDDDLVRFSVLRFKAEPGERNRLTVRRTSGGRIRFHDGRARVRPGRGCRAAGRRTVVCRRPRDMRFVRVHLLGGADRLTVSRRLRTWVEARGGTGHDRMTAGGGRATLLGELGDDRLVGGARGDVLAGGGGRDRLHGRGGRDHVAGGSGADRLLGGAGTDTLDVGGESKPDRDRADGGPGRDTASYEQRFTSVVISTSGGGRTGERDVFESVEDLRSGGGADLLLGDDGPNRLDAGWGRDRIRARGGDDRIRASFVGIGGGTLDAGCGDGDDVLVTPYGDPRLLVRRDCEQVRFENGSAPIDPRPAPPADRAFRMLLSCEAGPGTVVVRTARSARPWSMGPFGVEVATAAAPRGPAGTLCPVDFALTDRGQALLTARGELPVELPTSRYDMISVVLTSA